jgi:hypothetical protein
MTCNEAFYLAGTTFWVVGIVYLCILIWTVRK